MRSIRPSAICTGWASSTPSMWRWWTPFHPTVWAIPPFACWCRSRRVRDTRCGSGADTAASSAFASRVAGARTLDLSARVSKLGGTPKGSTGLNQFCNPFGGAWKFDTLNYSVGLTLRQPAFLKRSNVGSLGLLAERHSEFTVFTREAVGGNADLTFNARGRLPVTVGYSYSLGRTQASAGVYCSLFRVCDATSQEFLRKSHGFGAATVTIVSDRVNNLLDPTEGRASTRSLVCGP